jgi:hypothetical protein
LTTQTLHGGDTQVGGLYLYDGSALHTLVNTLNPVFDGQALAWSLPFFLSPQGFSGDQVAFSAAFGPGIDHAPTSYGNYLATISPVPEPSTLGLTGFCALAFLIKRRQVRAKQEA